VKKHEAAQGYPLEPFAQFLEEYPSLSPGVSGDDTAVDGFQVGGCFLTITDMEWLFAGPADWRVPRLLAVCEPPTYEA